MKYSKWIVLIIIILNTVFTTAVLLTYKTTGSEPTALIAAWFAFTTGELFMAAKIKLDDNKIRKDGNDENKLDSKDKQP